MQEKARNMDQELLNILQTYLKQSNRVSWGLYEQQDLSRRLLGKQFDMAGFGPIETPSKVVFAEPGLTLKYYGTDHPNNDRPVMLIVPAPIKRAYIWDLVPWASVVRHCLSRGLSVYLAQWERPGPDEPDFGLAEYADRLILDCLQVIEEKTGQSQAFLAGHSVGGTFAAIFAALRPEHVKGLVLLGTPLHFGPDVGPIDAMVAAAPRAQTLTKGMGRVPGSFITRAAVTATPSAFAWDRWMDRMLSLSFPDPQAMLTYVRVERWTLDEFPLPQRLFEEVVESLYREDRFMQRTLEVGGSRVAPEMVSAPLLSVIDPRCTVVPPDATMPFYEAVTSADKKLLTYHGDVGVSIQHVGPLVGRNAHQRLWPEIISWIHSHQ
jgi:polyhydroxyalkanoate synthase